jgi:polyhydroxyalkanoate synthesis regulator phasin
VSDKEPSPNPFDPSGFFRQGRDAYLDAWAQAMVEAVNSDQYAKATGAMLDSYLTASSPLRDVLEKSMQRVLQQLSMPSRADFLSLAERVTNIEMRLDDMDAKLDRLVGPSKPTASRAGTAKAGSAPKKRRSRRK